MYIFKWCHKSGAVKSGAVKSCDIKSGAVKSCDIKSGAVKSGANGFFYKK